MDFRRLKNVYPLQSRYVFTRKLSLASEKCLISISLESCTNLNFVKLDQRIITSVSSNSHTISIFQTRTTTKLSGCWLSSKWALVSARFSSEAKVYVCSETLGTTFWQPSRGQIWRFNLFPHFLELSGHTCVALRKNKHDK